MLLVMPAPLIKGIPAGNTDRMAIQSRLPAFLLTRPMVQSKRFAASLRSRFGSDLSVTISPLIAPRFLTPAFPDLKPASLIFTSETGVESFVRHPARPKDLPLLAYCVGDRTAQTAQRVGLKAISANGDAASLVARIRQDKTARPLLHICGAQTRGDIARHLSDAGYDVATLVLYEQEQQQITAAAKTLLLGENPVMVPLFSPRSAALFLAQLSQVGANAPLFFSALSDAVAEPLVQRGRLAHCIAAKPTAEALIDAMAGFFAAS